jgi:5-methylcytosine-specific restriction endonuclease McrA
MSESDVALMIERAICSGSLLTVDGLWMVAGWSRYIDRPNQSRRAARERLIGGRVPADLRRKILSSGKCVFCGTGLRLTVDHRVPVALGGTHSESNLQCLCKSCNCRKRDRVQN